MEDIFFGKEVSRTYDLKGIHGPALTCRSRLRVALYQSHFLGSKRNRMSKEDNIFLDMNYINHMRDNPVYIDKASHSGALF